MNAVFKITRNCSICTIILSMVMLIAQACLLYAVLRTPGENVKTPEFAYLLFIPICLNFAGLLGGVLSLYGIGAGRWLQLCTLIPIILVFPIGTVLSGVIIYYLFVKKNHSSSRTEKS